MALIRAKNRLLRKQAHLRDLKDRADQGITAEVRIEGATKDTVAVDLLKEKRVRKETVPHQGAAAEAGHVANITANDPREVEAGVGAARLTEIVRSIVTTVIIIKGTIDIGGVKV